MQERILIIGTYLTEFFTEAVKENNWEFMLIDFKLNRYRNFLPILKSKIFAGNIEKEFITKKIEAEIITRLNAIKKFEPTRILILRGYNFNENTITILKSIGAPIYLWFYDSLFRHPEQKKILGLCKKAFAVDGGDITDYKNLIWMPIGYANTFFYPDAEKLYDVLFIGRVNNKNYKTRLMFLKQLNSMAINIKANIAFSGTTGSFLKNKIIASELNNIHFLGKQKLKDYCSLIRKSTICINIHQDDGLMPVNPLFFSINAAGVCQLTDNRTYFANWLKPLESYVPVSSGNFLSLIQDLLKDQNKLRSIGLHGMEEVKQFALSKQLKNLFDL